MFGYVRPLKSELLVREFSRYKSIYCGICKQIGHDYGQLPRLTLGYDLTLLAILLLSLSDEQPPDELAGCITNPLARRPIARGGSVLELCAALTVLLAWHKSDDDVRDENKWSSRLIQAMLGSSRRKAAKRFPEYDQIIGEELENLRIFEAGDPDPAAAEIFGRLLQRVFTRAAELVTDRQEIREGIGRFGFDLGQWIYLLDAIDDLPDDCNNKSWNPFSRLEISDARESATTALTKLEQEMDRTAALLPYQRDAGLLANIVLQGLSAIRQQVMQGEKLKRL